MMRDSESCEGHNKNMLIVLFVLTLSLLEQWI